MSDRPMPPACMKCEQVTGKSTCFPGPCVFHLERGQPGTKSHDVATLDRIRRGSRDPVRTAAMDALIADSADLYDAPASADAMGEVERVARAIERELDVQELVLTDPITLRRLKAKRIATAALSAMSPAGEVERAVLAERERCAKIVEARVEPSWHLAAKNAAYVIAKAVREPKP